ncbi:hypothetical protein [Micromonospora eburnea]|uniref:Peptidoglycan binding domain-containing protein n=1 Tax=Micromonospora eburnea TaxID=227316 RepID=A0A1C6UYB8_9ACTN|nr:hypothetical protein [Micromonospora eburnea]SCL59026.1 hypothetical protein GA0070604_3963 [Micromonospora eburnea]
MTDAPAPIDGYPAVPVGPHADPPPAAYSSALDAAAPSTADRPGTARSELAAGPAPFVVCGPVLRRVDPGSATVFVAVRSACTVTLTVFESGPGHIRGPVVATGSRSAIRLGERLYVVAVRASGTLEPGRLYGYDLSFSGAAGSWDSLLAPTVVAASGDEALKLLTYVDPDKPGAAPEYPSFATPPADPGQLRIFHGSCRKPHGEGRDALPALDQAIAETVGDPGRRPHQLVLTGDQIYADDVADVLLAMIQGHDAVPARDGQPAVPASPGVAVSLGMPPESLPMPGEPTDRSLVPGRRAETLATAAKFTSGAADSHLMSLREYVCMYLMVWSDQLWPATYPRFEDVFPADTRILQDPQGRRPGETVYDLLVSGRAYSPSGVQRPIAERYLRWHEQAIRLRFFQQGLPEVRRQLANVPTYMVADDHEVSDDWNITRDWVENAVIGSPLGRRIVRNAMSAYVVFQAWGNDPTRFAEEGAAGEPGRELLSALGGWLAAPNDPDDQRLRTRLGLPTGITPEGRIARPGGALVYHFAVTWPRYQLLALDTRTWREFPTATRPGGLLLADHPLIEMVSGGGVLDDEAVTVVAQPIAVFGMPLLERVVQPLALVAAGRYAADLEDAWLASEAAAHKFLGRLLAAAPPGPDGVRRRRVVLLGGDIHFGSAERIRYSATLPYGCGPDPARPFEGVNRTEGVIAGFVSSALRNEDDKTKILHTTGYAPVLPVGRRLDLVGWANEEAGRAGERFPAGTEVAVAADAGVGWWVSGRPAVGDYDGLKLLSRPPEWIVQVQFLRHDESDPQAPDDTTPEPVWDPAGLPDREKLEQYAAAVANLERWIALPGAGREIVGHNNLGEVTFSWPAGEGKSATQRLWWYGPDGRIAPLTAHRVDLSYGCSLLAPAPYGGYLLERDDHDATAGEQARYGGADRPADLVTENWVGRLHADLATLGFDQQPALGRYDAHTYRAVREFQTYARSGWAAREPAGATAPRYSDRLEPVEVPEAERYHGPIHGVADLPTQVAIQHWLEKRWRAPVVVEAWQVTGGTPQHLAAANVWRSDTERPADQRLYSRMVTGRPADAGPAPVTHPELIPLGFRVTRPDQPEWSGPVVEPVSELLPEALLPRPAGQATGPSLPMLVATARHAEPVVAEPALRRLSTFKVLRAVAENTRTGSAGGYFDVVDGSDRALLRLGPFGWPADGPRPAPVNPPVFTLRCEPGQLWAWLAALRATDRDAYEALGGLAGLSATPGWGRDGNSLWCPELGLRRARMGLSGPDAGVPFTIENLVDVLDLRAWHWVHRFTLALRTHDGVRRSIWHFARQGLRDLLGIAWDPPNPARRSVPDVPGADGTPRRVRIGDLFTSERAVALLACWQTYRAHQLVVLGTPNDGEPQDERKRPRAARELRNVLARARTLGPDFSGPPTGWTDAHEAALITALAQVAGADPEVAAALTAVGTWPDWPDGRGYALPIEALDGEAGEPGVGPGLSARRGSLRLDIGDLPWGTR